MSYEKKPLLYSVRRALSLHALLTLYANSTTKCPKEIMKIFLIEDFFPFVTSVNGNGGAP